MVCRSRNGSGQGDPRFVWSAISVDAVGQFQVQTSGYSALYEAKACRITTWKQGGNAYHGSLYEFFRNTALDAWGFVKGKNPYTGLPQKPVEHQNEFGIAIGGPLIPFGSWRKSCSTSSAITLDSGVPPPTRPSRVTHQ